MPFILSWNLSFPAHPVWSATTAARRKTNRNGVLIFRVLIWRSSLSGQRGLIALITLVCAQNRGKINVLKAHCQLLSDKQLDRVGTNLDVFARWRVYGEVSEWLKELVLKTSDLLRGPWVRIPPSPPISLPTRPVRSGAGEQGGGGERPFCLRLPRVLVNV